LTLKFIGIFAYFSIKKEFFSSLLASQSRQRLKSGLLGLLAGGVKQGSRGLQGEGQAGRRTAKHDGQMSDAHGKGQVAQAARWLATLKASGCLCLLDGRGMARF